MRRFQRIALAAVACAALCALLSSCGTQEESTSGATFSPPETVAENVFDESQAVKGNGCAIDTSHAQEGYVGVRGTASSALKFQVASGNMSYNYDIPADGSIIFCPINMGSGSYTFRCMQNTSANNYVEILSTAENVQLSDDFQPYLHPNVFCDFDEASACTAKARQLCAGAENEGDALQAICTWIEDNISYDEAKAATLQTTTGYVPDPDETLASGTGICFDYASLGAAMLRSVGIPCQIVTGYVSPDDVYHAWIMVYIDGTWTSGEFKVTSDTWSRVDLTFAASSGATSYVGDGKEYTDRYVY